jgi:hypothetical protein
MKDGIRDFFTRFRIDDDEFISFGIESIVLAEPQAAFTQWQLQVKEIESGQTNVFVRPFGRTGHGREHMLTFYSSCMNLKRIEFDPTNNAIPYRTFSSITKNKKGKDLINYKLSHIWGRTKNPYTFCAPWNMCYTPIFIDPFTGHESKGELSTRFASELKRLAFDRFKQSIELFNELMFKLKPSIDDYIDQLTNDSTIVEKDRSKLVKSMKENFSPITS